MKIVLSALLFAPVLAFAQVPEIKGLQLDMSEAEVVAHNMQCSPVVGVPDVTRCMASLDTLAEMKAELIVATLIGGKVKHIQITFPEASYRPVVEAMKAKYGASPRCSGIASTSCFWTLAGGATLAVFERTPFTDRPFGDATIDSKDFSELMMQARARAAAKRAGNL